MIPICRLSCVAVLAGLALLAALLVPINGVADAAAQPVPQQVAPAQPAPATRPAVLGEEWFGRWYGPTQVVLPGGRVLGEFSMGIEIGPAPDQPAGAAPVYLWSITYEMGDNVQTRPYLLRIAVDDAGNPLPGHFVLDQRTGILVDQFLVDRTMQGHFIVTSGEDRQILHARYELIKDEAGKPALEVEISTYDGNEQRRTGAGAGGVDSRRLLRLQRGVLARQEAE